MYYSFCWKMIFFSTIITKGGQIRLIFSNKSRSNKLGLVVYKYSKNSDWPHRLLNLLYWNLLWGTSDWIFNSLKDKKPSQDSATDFVCNRYRFGWIPLFTQDSKAHCFLKVPGNDLPYLVRLLGNLESKILGCFSKGLC